MPTDMANAPLRCEVRNGRLVLSIGVETLAFCWDHRTEVECALEDEDGSTKRPQGWPFKVIDQAAFAKEVARAMLNEAEDGSSPATRFIDAACEAAADDGAEGLNYGYDEEQAHAD